MYTSEFCQKVYSVFEYLYFDAVVLCVCTDESHIDHFSMSVWICLQVIVAWSMDFGGSENSALLILSLWVRRPMHQSLNS